MPERSHHVSLSASRPRPQHIVVLRFAYRPIYAPPSFVTPHHVAAPYAQGCPVGMTAGMMPGIAMFFPGG